MSFNVFHINLMRLNQMLLIVFIWVTSFQFRFIKQSEGLRVFELGYLPSTLKYVDELILMIIVVFTFLRLCYNSMISLKNFKMLSYILLIFVYLLLSVLKSNLPIVFSILFLRSEFQGVFFFLLLCMNGIQEDVSFQDKLIKTFKLLLIFTMLMLFVQSLGLYFTIGTFYLRDFAIGIFGPGHNLDVGFLMTMFFIYGVYKFRVEGYTFKNISLVIASVFGMLLGEYKTGLVFLPIVLLIILRMNIGKKVVFVSLFSILIILLMSYFNSFSIEGLVSSQLSTIKGSSGRIFLLTHTYNKVILGGKVLFGVGPGNFASNVTQIVNSSVYEEISNFRFSGGIPQIVILLGEIGVIGIMIVFVFFIFVWRSCEYNKVIIFTLYLYYLFCFFIVQIMELQIASMIFWSFIAYFGFKKINLMDGVVLDAR